MEHDKFIYFHPCLAPTKNSAGTTEGFSMCGGDFVEVYCDPSQEGRRKTHSFCQFIVLNALS